MRATCPDRLIVLDLAINNLLLAFRIFFRHSLLLPGWGSAGRKACTYTGKHKQKYADITHMPQEGFEPTIPLFELQKPTPYTA
jgi:hypothetical protein